MNNFQTEVENDFDRKTDLFSEIFVTRADQNLKK